MLAKLANSALFFSSPVQGCYALLEGTWNSWGGKRMVVLLSLVRKSAYHGRKVLHHLETALGRFLAPVRRRTSARRPGVEKMMCGLDYSGRVSPAYAGTEKSISPRKVALGGLPETQDGRTSQGRRVVRQISPVNHPEVDRSVASPITIRARRQSNGGQMENHHTQKTLNIKTPSSHSGPSSL
ncbi:hypothetical protein BJ166DRAFT_5779 [Pestalotiopsis sp. NC0098]|nr:hypothetical protein BJ166DRAFT_5779 [Pestalotiopsis sp. NC0098]